MYTGFMQGGDREASVPGQSPPSGMVWAGGKAPPRRVSSIRAKLSSAASFSQAEGERRGSAAGAQGERRVSTPGAQGAPGGAPNFEAEEERRGSAAAQGAGPGGDQHFNEATG